MTHTKGPWLVDEEAEDNAGQITLGITSDNRPGYVCGIHCAEGVDLDVIDRANAVLIAAAPAMYEALKLCVEALEFIPCRARNEANEALRLAEGR